MTFEKWLELTQTDDAAAAALFKRDRAHISKIRRGKVTPSFDLMIVIRDKTEGAVPLDSWAPIEGRTTEEQGREPTAA